MNLAELAENFGAKSDGGGHVSWTSAMSTYMLRHLSNLVASGTRTSTGFKKVHLNACARALNEHFKLRLTADQISNHVRTWKRKWAKIIKLKKLSGAGWDEDNCVITLHHDHYTNYIEAHKADAEYLNKAIEHYREMATIFGNTLATGKYAKGSSDPLGTEVTEIEEDEVQNENNAAATAEDCTQSQNNGESSAPRAKRAKSASTNEKDIGLQGTLKYGLDRLATAVEKFIEKDDKEELPKDLWQPIKNLSDFDGAHLAHYYAYLVENPSITKAFHTLDVADKYVWVSRYVAKNFDA